MLTSGKPTSCRVRLTSASAAAFSSAAHSGPEAKKHKNSRIALTQTRYFLLMPCSFAVRTKHRPTALLCSYGMLSQNPEPACKVRLALVKSI
ncbi:hypothetical protein GALL_533370 [mine drainage metagenome]|uniref:Uncharacterized protein n=1 Tax=mine drainage metagenome TaxID=410659 RepID=A0A1J5PC78_9ZZZZ